MKAFQELKVQYVKGVERKTSPDLFIFQEQGRQGSSGAQGPEALAKTSIPSLPLTFHCQRQVSQPLKSFRGWQRDGKCLNVMQPAL